MGDNSTAHEICWIESIWPFVSQKKNY